MKPRILVTARECMNGKNPAWQVNKDYTDAIIQAGGIPIICSPTSDEDLESIIDLCEGVMITGGDDLNPSLYRASLHEKTICSDERLDAMDMKIIQYAYKFHKPILGICRGIQSINVAFGGSLYQDILTEIDNYDGEGHSNTSHIVYFKDGTYGQEIFWKSYLVNSFHHQCIKQLGFNLKVSGVSDDGIIEAIQGRDLFAVQWHPERMKDSDETLDLFVEFIKSCRKRM